MTVSSILIACIILFAASLTKATLGFGESLLAVPLLTLTVGLQVAAPVMALIGASVSFLLLARGWREVDFGVTRRLTLAAAVGVPPGVWGLKRLPAVWMTAALGVMLILIGLYNLTQPTLKPLKGEKWTYLFGFLAGVSGGAYSMGGPPVLVYGAARRWSAQQFRITLQGFFLPLSLIIVLSHAGAGLWTQEVLQLFVLSIPVMLLAFRLGNWISQRLRPETFERLVYVALVVFGVMLLM
jgi:uncharacterized membrane protein YfcA